MMFYLTCIIYNGRVRISLRHYLLFMKILLQKVSEARVEVEDKVIGQIGAGILLFLGITHEDTEKDVDFLVDKVLNLRIFKNEEEEKYFDKSVLDISGDILVVSQFTLYGKTDKGRRPSFVEAAKPEEAERLYNLFVQKIREKSGLRVETGQFQAMMQVHLVNDGPVTLVIRSQ